MIWQKEKGIENRQNLDYMILAMIVFFLIAIIFNQALLFAVIGMMLGYLTLVKIYDHHIGQKLHLKNERTSIRLFPGDEATLTFELHNKSIIPYVNGDFTFQTDKNMRIIYDQVHLHKRDRKSTRLNSSHVAISYAVFCLKKKNIEERHMWSAKEVLQQCCKSTNSLFV